MSSTYNKGYYSTKKKYIQAESVIHNLDLIYRCNLFINDFKLQIEKAKCFML